VGGLSYERRLPKELRDGLFMYYATLTQYLPGKVKMELTLISPFAVYKLRIRVSLISPALSRLARGR